MKRRFWGSNIALCFGIMLFVTAYYGDTDILYTADDAAAHVLTGLIMTLMSLGYKSIKKRRLGIATKFIKLRRCFEIGALIVSALLPFTLMGMTPREYWDFLIESDEVTTPQPFIAFAWGFLAYGHAWGAKIE